MLLPILGQPMICHLLDRLNSCQLTNPPIVLTANTPENKQLMDVVARHGWMSFAPDCDPNDVLSRFWEAHLAFNQSNLPIVRITGDCPLIDNYIVDAVIAGFIALGNLDYASLNNDFPDGLDIEIFKPGALFEAYTKTVGHDREHVTPFIYKNPSLFKQYAFPCSFDLSEEKWSVDTEEDYEFVKNIYENLYPKNFRFSFREIYGYVQSSGLNIAFMNREKRNQGYLDQAGIKKSWGEFRFGSQ